MRPASSTVQQVLRLSAAICARSESSVSCSRPILGSPSLRSRLMRVARPGDVSWKTTSQAESSAPGETEAEIDDGRGASVPPIAATGATLRGRCCGGGPGGRRRIAKRRFVRRLARRMRSRTRTRRRDRRRSGLRSRCWRAGSCGFGTGTGAWSRPAWRRARCRTARVPAWRFAAPAGSRAPPPMPPARCRCGACACRLGLVRLRRRAPSMPRRAERRPEAHWHARREQRQR